jgi:hypothetical protein
MIQQGSWAKQVRNVFDDECPYVFITQIDGNNYWHRHLGSNCVRLCYLVALEELTLEDIAYLYYTQTIEEMPKGGEDGKGTG